MLTFDASTTYVDRRKLTLHNWTMASELSDRIRAARKRAKLTQRQLAEGCDVDRAAVSQWEAKSPDKRTRPTWANLQRLALFADVPYAWLVDDNSDVTPPEGEPFNPLPPEQYVPPREPLDKKLASIANGEIRDGYVRFPLLEGFAGMGRGDYIGDYPEVVDFIEVTLEWVSQKLRGVPIESIRVITGRGDSMRGQYNDGDLVFVDSRIRSFNADSAYVYRWNGQVQIKRLQLIGGGRVRILSKNPDYPSIDVGIDELEIGGRALAAWTLKEF